MTISTEKQWRQARLARDPRFDGTFYIGVLTTGIFCRPICPAQPPKEENIRYFNSASLAIEQGFRPCRRCRPEYAPTPQQQWPDERIDITIKSIDRGFLDTCDLPQLAANVKLSERQLRRLFVKEVGVTPSQMADTRRLFIAKQLLRESNLSITDAALASGYRSVRRFNSAIKKFYLQTPSEIRQRNRTPHNGNIHSCQIQLPHGKDYPWQQVLDFFQRRVIDGLEAAQPNGFSRVLCLFDNPIVITIKKSTKFHHLTLTITNARAEQISAVIIHVRKVLDLNTHHETVTQWLRKDPLLKKLIKPSDRIALPGAWDVFEYLVRAIIGQQISVKAAKTLTQRIIDKFGLPVTIDQQAFTQFPTPQKLANSDLTGLGLTHRRIDTIQAIARAHCQLPLNACSQTQRQELQQRLLTIKGIGPWTVDYLMMRGFFQPDIWLDTDLGVINAFKQIDENIDKKYLRQRAENWSPWRSYAVLALWQTL